MHIKRQSSSFFFLLLSLHILKAHSNIILQKIQCILVVIFWALILMIIITAIILFIAFLFNILLWIISISSAFSHLFSLIIIDVITQPLLCYFPTLFSLLDVINLFRISAYGIFLSFSWSSQKINSMTAKLIFLYPPVLKVFW